MDEIQERAIEIWPGLGRWQCYDPRGGMAGHLTRLVRYGDSDSLGRRRPVDGGTL